MLLEAWDWLLQKVHGGLDHFFWSNIVHRVSGLLQTEKQVSITDSNGPWKFDPLNALVRI